MQSPIADNEKALDIIKREGPQSISEIATAMGVTVEGARFHLLKLEKDGLVVSINESKGRGRPKQIWSLTEKGNSRFPNTHDKLSANLIHLMKEALGDDAVDKVIDRHQESLQERYSAEIDQDNNLEERITRLVELRTSDGYMADYIKENDHYLFIENHCPICSAASVCQGFCRAEIDTFQKVLGDDVDIKRVDHIVQGARRCSYKIVKS